MSQVLAGATKLVISASILAPPLGRGQELTPMHQTVADISLLNSQKDLKAFPPRFIDEDTEVQRRPQYWRSGAQSVSHCHLNFGPCYCKMSPHPPSIAHVPLGKPLA